MSKNKKCEYFHAGYKKKRNKKRQATSPLNDNGSLCVNSGEDAGNNSNNRTTKKQSKKCKAETNKMNTQSNSGHTFNLNSQYPNMSFTGQSYGSMSQPMPQMPQMPFGHTSPPAQYSGNAFPFQPSPPPPLLANELLEDMKLIKSKLQSIGKIEKTVNSINSKVSDLETKMKDLDVRVNETEKSCAYSSAETETNKKDIKQSKDDIKQLKKDCDNLKKGSASFTKQASEMDRKLTDLESRSMRDNLMFYGLKEGGDAENCGEQVKELMVSVLHVDNANNILFDLVHRVGQKSGKNRPIVAKFHYYTDRERVRQTSYTYANDLKTADLGVGAQLPKSLRDARKPLYPAMKEAKDAGKEVKFVGSKLFINGAEHKLPTPTPMES